MMTSSGARGNKGNIGQLGGMRGLMADPSGRIIDVPVRSNFREGMTVLEYFISTHGARKGLADIALRTADSGYLTRRLVDVAQDVITRDEDCGTEEGTWITRDETEEFAAPPTRTSPSVSCGRLSAATITDPTTKGGESSSSATRRSRSPSPCASPAAPRRLDRRSRGASARRSAASHDTASAAAATAATWPPGTSSGIGEAVGIIAAQSIGEPGTQLTMRTFHTGGVAGLDITAGLPRVEELFEARIPKGKAEISHIDGVVEIMPDRERRRDASRSPRARSSRRPSELAKGHELLVAPGDPVEANQVVGRQRGQGRHGRRRSARPTRGLMVKADDGAATCAARTSSSASTPSRTTPSCASRTGSWSAPATRSPTGRSTRRNTWRREVVMPSSATWSRRSSGLSQPGRDHQRQAHRDHRPADAAQGARRPAGRHASSCRSSSSTASSSRRSTTASWLRAASRRRPRPCCSA